MQVHQLAAGRLGDDQPYRITTIPENGVLTKIGTGGIEIPVALCDQILRTDELLLRSNGAIIPEGATIGFTPVEQLEITITETPDRGAVFNPNVAQLTTNSIMQHA